jgi:hypothetical protein
MTVSRILMAVALVVIAVMIVGVQRNVLEVGDRIEAIRVEIGGHLTEIGGSVEGLPDKIKPRVVHTVVVRKGPVARVGRPRVPPVKHLPPQVQQETSGLGLFSTSAGPGR